MRIAHVVTLLSPDQRFGGPARVCLDLAREQLALGHEVVVFAGSAGYLGQPPTEVGGVPVVLFPVKRTLPGLGYAGLRAPGLVKSLKSFCDDGAVGHVHLARDFITTDAAIALRGAGQNYVIQTHGMVDAPSRPLGSIADLLRIRRIAASASAVLVLTEDERNHMRALGVSSRKVALLRNGIERGSLAQEGSAQRAVVLFLARLHPRKGAEEFVEASLRICSEFPNLHFQVCGPDEGSADAVRRVLASAAPSNVSYLGPVPPDAVGALMLSSALYVLPAKNEPFGMTLLEAMRAGTPVIVESTAALASEIVSHRAGLAYHGGSEALAALMRRMLSDGPGLEEWGENGRRLIEEKFSLGSVVQSVMQAYGAGAQQ